MRHHSSLGMASLGARLTSCQRRRHLLKVRTHSRRAPECMLEVYQGSVHCTTKPLVPAIARPGALAVCALQTSRRARACTEDMEEGASLWSSCLSTTVMGSTAPPHPNCWSTTPLSSPCGNDARMPAIYGARQTARSDHQQMSSNQQHRQAGQQVRCFYRRLSCSFAPVQAVLRRWRWTLAALQSAAA
jgi:hypothetical protein